MNKYDIIFEVLQSLVDNNRLTLEDGSIINDLAYDRYITEDGHSKKLKARHNQKKKNNEERFKKNLNYDHEYTDSKTGDKHGNIHIGDNKRVSIVIKNGKNSKENYDNNFDPNTGTINTAKKSIQMKGSDLMGGHEYSHALDDVGKIHKVKLQDNTNGRRANYDKTFRKKLINAINEQNNHIEKLNKKDNIDRIATEEFYKHKKETGRGLNKHDRNIGEVRADIFANKSLNNDHGSNINRKIDNELYRRINQDKNNKNPFREIVTKRSISEYISQIKDTKNEINDYIKRLNDLKGKLNEIQDEDEKDKLKNKIEDLNFLIKTDRARIQKYHINKDKAKSRLKQYKKSDDYLDDLSKRKSYIDKKEKIIKQQVADRYKVVDAVSKRLDNK